MVALGDQTPQIDAIVQLHFPSVEYFTPQQFEKMGKLVIDKYWGMEAPVEALTQGGTDGAAAAK